MSDQIAALGLVDHVRLLGPRPQDEVRWLLREAAAFAAPCVVASDDNRDGLPTVLLEAMALGAPCVATPVTGIPEAVRHGDTGLLVDEHAPLALAHALQRLLTDARTASGLAQRARALIETDFDSRCQAARVREHFEGAEAAALAGVA